MATDIDLRDWGVTGAGANETAGLNAALAAAVTGQTVVIRTPLTRYKITAPLAIPDGVTVVAEAPGVIIEQTTWGQPVFDLNNTDDVTVDGLSLVSTQTRSYSSQPSFRGSDPYVYNTGVWANGSRCTFRNLTASGFTCGVYITSWNGTNFLTNVSNNTVENLTVSTVDFGLLVVGQDSPLVSGIRGSYTQTVGTGNPPHLIYWSDGVVGGGSESRGITVSDCSATGGTESYPFQFKGINGGTITGLTSRGCAGSTAVFNCEDVIITGISSRGDPGDGSGNGVIFFGDDDSVRTRIENIAIELATESRIARVGGTDCTIRSLTAKTTHATTADTADVTIQGTRCRIEDVAILNSNSAGGWRAFDVTAGTDNVVRNIRAQYCRTGVYVNSGAVGTLLDVEPTHIVGAVGYGGFRPVDNNSTTTNLNRWQRRNTYTGTGGTFTFQAALGDYHEVSITGATATTIAEPYTFSRATGSQMTVAVVNTTGGAMGTLTWNAAFVFRGAAPSAPAAGDRVIVTFVFDGTSWQELAPAATAVTPRVFNAMAYGAAGDDSTDDYAAILAAINAANAVAGKVYFPAGNYRISQPVPFKVSMDGETRASTIIKCTESAAAFTGTMMLDFNTTGLNKKISQITWDTRGHTGIQHFGSTSDASGSSGSTFEDLDFQNGPAGTYAVGGASVAVTGGMLTGSLFLRCNWTNCAQPLYVGQNQDDVMLIGSRVQQAFRHSTAVPFRLEGQNITMLNSFLYMETTDNASSIKAIIQLGSFPVKISGMFLETAASVAYTHIFQQANPNVQFQADTVRWGASATLPGFVAACYARLDSTTAAGSYIAIRGLDAKSGTPCPLVYQVVATTSGSTSRLSLTIDGADDWTSLIALASSPTASTSLIRVTGHHNGTSYNSQFTPTAGVAAMTPLARGYAIPAVTGSRGGNAALASLLTQLAATGLITDSSSA